ncbi:MAG TPA: cysteine-rich CWC family protein [Polyangiaceae bacterium]|nr:cysteine-rich CWC family protein [Polyangiaceae bacterium]
MSGTAAAATAPAAARCALCGKPNGCAMAAGATSAQACWCMGEEMPAALDVQLKQEGIEWCICQACMRRAQQVNAAGGA